MKLNKVLVFDVENTTFKREDGTRDYSPFHTANKLVSIGWGWINDGVYSKGGYRFFHHKTEPPCPTKVILAKKEFQDALDMADLVVGWNLRHDLQWAKACGFHYEGPIFDGMVADFITLRGLKGKSVSLEATAERRNVFRKKGDLVRQYLDDDVQFDEIPIAITIEYGEADVQSTAEAYLSLVEDYSGPSKGMVAVCNLAMDFCDSLTKMEENGIAIDVAALEEVEADYRAEQIALTKRLDEIVYEVMGDKPYSLSSTEQLSQVIYSRKVIDKDLWKKTFNIGLDERKKPLRRPRMSPVEFGKAVKSNVTRLKKTTAIQCDDCTGSGFIRKVTVKGKEYKNLNICKKCNKSGYLYIDTNHWAGFKFSPRGVQDCSDGGFATDKETLALLKIKAETNGQTLAVEFLSGIMRLNAISTYLSNFVGGIKRGLLDNGIIHPRYNQTVAATQRLSSSEPNFQNMPVRDKSFPIRKAIVSRFKGGEIWEFDFSGLEFKVAGFLSKDPVIYKMVKEKEDPHRKTGSIIYQVPAKQVNNEQRQASKEHTFKPLFGGTGFAYPPHIARYYDDFTTKTYQGVGRWHRQLQDEAIANKKLVVIDGKEFSFPNASRTKSGGAIGATQIKNYEVQYLSTGMIVPLSIVRLTRLLNKHKMKSLLTNTVHDSGVLDVHPDDDKILLVKLIVEATDVKQEIMERFGFDLDMPLDIELAGGKNWRDKKLIAHHDIDIQGDIPF